MDRGHCKLYYATLKSYGVVVSYNSINPMTVILYYGILTLHITRLHISFLSFASKFRSSHIIIFVKIFPIDTK